MAMQRKGCPAPESLSFARVAYTDQNSLPPKRDAQPGGLRGKNKVQFAALSRTAPVKPNSGLDGAPACLSCGAHSTLGRGHFILYPSQL